MKIWLITTKASVGGVQVFLIGLARFLSSEGHDVTVAAGAGDFLAANLQGSGAKFFRLTSLAASNNPLSAGRYIQELRRVLKSERPDVVHFNSSHALLGVLALGGLGFKIKTVFTVHGLSILDKNYEIGALKRLAYQLVFRCLLRLIDKTVFVCRANMAEAAAMGLGRSAEMIYNGIEKYEPSLSRGEARAYLSTVVNQNLDHALIIGSVGRLAYPKNFGFLIRIWPEVMKREPTARLIVLGGGKEEAELRSLIASLDLSRSVFIIPVEPARPYLSGFDIFVLPSRYEGLPLTLLESLAAGLPVLATRVGGNQEVLDHEAELYALDDCADFLERLHRLVSDRKLREEVAAVNRRAALRFSSEEMGRRYLAIYS